ncbi:hypothetical protein ANN_13339 [Periplaneta americana]|uniref:Uncharacterized protein n=1 Tax=Periplaneta americana TaxID=6978 RepID=A0ABQ8TLQ0_PERAM|nr:hypothetical protein ANN_13339 [Periplaneta americana]
MEDHESGICRPDFRIRMSQWEQETSSQIVSGQIPTQDTSGPYHFSTTVPKVDQEDMTDVIPGSDYRRHLSAGAAYIQRSSRGFNKRIDSDRGNVAPLDRWRLDKNRMTWWSLVVTITRDETIREPLTKQLNCFAGRVIGGTMVVMEIISENSSY